jgi:hypothetical protein
MGGSRGRYEPRDGASKYHENVGGHPYYLIDVRHYAFDVAGPLPHCKPKILTVNPAPPFLTYPEPGITSSRSP